MTPGERSYEIGFMAGLTGYFTDELTQCPIVFQRGMQDGRRHRVRKCSCGWCMATKKRATDLAAIEAAFARFAERVAP